MALSPGNSALDDPDELPPGSRVGPYVILERLGHGGMGQVFLGNDPRLHRRVALKRLTIAAVDRADERARILNEARAAARISHPNVATIHDILDHDSHAFIVMEYVAGESLAGLMRRERLPIDRIVAIGRQLASALIAAHANRIIHRDLKPANVQLTADGTVKVLDFGVAIVNAGFTTTTGASGVRVQAELPAGTPGYMAPEQRLGRAVDERSDVFSLGVVLFEMCTGQLPYKRADFLALFDAMEQPARADALRPDVPRELADLIAKAIDVEPDRRFQSALQIQQALDALPRELPAAIGGRTSGGEATSRAGSIVTAAALIALVPVVAGVLGFVNTQGFNLMLQRDAPFAREPWYAYFVWGLRSAVAPALYMSGASLVVAAVAFVIRVMNIVPPISRPLTQIRTRTNRVVNMIRLDDPVILSQAIAALAVFTLSLVLWAFRDLINAWTSFISTADANALRPLSPANVAQQGVYGVVLDVLMLGFGYVLYRLVKLRRKRGASAGNASVILVVVVLAIFVVLWEAPYRILWQNKRERIAVGSDRCYVIGEDGLNWLVYCPDGAPPHNRIIHSDDATIRRSGVIESIFTPAGKARSVS